jgi:hypothetical protein
MENTYLVLASIMVMLVFTLIHISHLNPALAQTSIPPTKMNLTNSTSINATKSTGNLTNSVINSTALGTDATENK